jgi:putative nucleotide binding protein
MFLKDENVIVLDFLASGHSAGRREAIAQVLGEKYFSLLEVVIKPETPVKNGDKLYIGEGKRDQVDHIKNRIGVKELTTFAKSELPFLVEKIVNSDEKRFVSFFNTAGPVSTRLHQLELLPGIGKKHMWQIIEERKKGPFKNFEDVRNRIKLMPDPKGAIIKRILQEIENENERYRIFAAGKPRMY